MSDLFSLGGARFMAFKDQDSAEEIEFRAGGSRDYLLHATI